MGRPRSFTTPRLRVRPWTLAEADVRAAHRIYGDLEVVRTIGGQVMGTPEAARDHLAMRLERRRRWKERYGAWAVELADSGEVVGTALMKPLPDAVGAYGDDVEIGWHLARSAWGQGYATEMGRGLIELARGEGLERLHAVAEPGNHRSLAVARRLGFVPRGLTRRYYSGLEVAHFVMTLRPPAEEIYRTERMRVRDWRTDDADVDAAIRIYSDPEVARYVGGPVDPDRERLRARMQARAERLARWAGRYGVWAAERLEDGEVFGTAMLKPLSDPSGALTDDFEAGWHLARSAWGEGYATEMGRGLIAHARQLGELGEIHALVDPPNLRSIAVAERLGFEHRGRTRAYYEGEILEHFVLPL